jgi:hypothetical protein
VNGSTQIVAAFDGVEGRARISVVDGADLPIADAGEARHVSFGETVILDGSASSDREGQELTYVWRQLSGADVTGGTGSLTGERATFTAPGIVGTLEFELIVDNGRSRSVPHPVHVNVLVNVRRAVYVAPGGSDAHPGTRTAPKATLQAAIDAAAAVPGGADVYAAEGSYSGGTLTLKKKVSVFGGFQAGSWIRDLALFPTDYVSSNATAVVGNQLQDVTIDGLRIHGSDVTHPDPRFSTAVGLRLVSSKNVTLSNNFIRAGHGRSGRAGFSPADRPAAGDGLPGLPGCENCGLLGNGGAGGGSPVFQGGAGGNGGYLAAEGRGFTGIPGAGGAQGGPGGLGSTICFVKGTNGLTGFSAPAAQNGASGFGGTGGQLQAEEYKAADGQGGWSGYNGRGGGGGGGGGAGAGIALLCAADRAGGGGGGGIGGFAGVGGEGAGASFAVLLINSHAQLTSNKLQAGNGGNGGAGGNGAAGGQGGSGAPGGNGPGDAGNGGRGGNGATGGAGGAGGGGAGGPSVGIGFTSTSSISVTATLNGNDFLLGTPGLGGAAGKTGLGVTTSGKGADAVAHAMMALK